MSSHHRQRQQQQNLHLLLLQNILAFRGGGAETSSPFTLVLDSVEQGAGGLVREVVRGVKASSRTINIIYISYTFHHPPPGIDTHISARRKTPEAVKAEITSACSSSTKKNLLILSPLTPLLTHPTLHIPTYLLSLLTPRTSLLAIHHIDVPLPLPSPSNPNPYAPPPLTLLHYLATTILTLHSLPQTLARQRASSRSLREPLFGLAEEKDGVIAGMGGNAYKTTGGGGGEGGMVVEMEHRRKSGRSVHETFFFPSPSSSSSGESSAFKGVVLLDQHPLSAASKGGGEKEGGEVQGEDLGGTFNLGLTEKQRRDREGVVLPYFDAQRRGLRGDDEREGEGERRGEGGRILYDMGVEDDFDEEEDEI
ncbi:MAG: hypothetical protein Q9208_008247 [Pyrenodesmia sp. 3 TL-2023]